MQLIISLLSNHVYKYFFKNAPKYFDLFKIIDVFVLLIALFEIRCTKLKYTLRFNLTIEFRILISG